MAGFITLLGGLSVLLTGVGAYRFTSYFYRNDPLFTGTMAFTLTLVYIITFDYILLGVGLLTLALPGVYIGRKTDLISDSGISGLPDPPTRLNPSNRAINRSTKGVLDPYEDQRCPNCNGFFDEGEQYCGHCGTELQEGNQ